MGRAEHGQGRAWVGWGRAQTHLKLPVISIIINMLDTVLVVPTATAVAMAVLYTAGSRKMTEHQCKRRVHWGLEAEG